MTNFKKVVSLLCNIKLHRIAATASKETREVSIVVLEQFQLLLR